MKTATMEDKIEAVIDEIRPAVRTDGGDVEFVEWEGEKPITVRWRLHTPLSERLGELFGLA